MSLTRPAAGGESCEAEFFIVIKIDLERSLIMKSVLVTAIGSFAADIIIKELKKMGLKEGDTIKIYAHEFEYYDTEDEE